MVFEIPKKVGRKKAIRRPPISKMQELKLRTWRDLHPSHRRAFDNRFDITSIFRDEMIRKRDSDIPQHSILEIIGDTGSGKSETAMNIALEWITHGPNQVKICMEASSFNEIAATANPGDCVIRDEQPKRVGLGSIRETLQMLNAGEIMRKFKFNIILVSPTPRSYVLAHYRLTTLWMDIEERVNRLAVLDPHRQLCLGSITVPIRNNNPLRREYESKKDEFIEATRKGRFTNDLLMKKSKELNEDERFAKIKNDRARKAYIRSLYPFFTGAEINHIIEIIKMLKKGILD